jgi:hypothetical protein
MKRLEPHAGLTETFAIFMRRISLTLVGKSSIPLLIQAVRDSKRPTDGYPSALRVAMGNAAEMLIKNVATTFPGVYKNHVQDFVSLLESEDPSLGMYFDRTKCFGLVKLNVFTVGDALEALSRFAKTFAEDLNIDG